MIAAARPGPGAVNPYGFVDEAEREYVITRPDTPGPWLNYIGRGLYGGIISNTAGGFSFDRDPRSRRVTRYRYNGIPADQPGRYVYIRDQETGAYWSPTWQPVKRDLDAYECRHGTAYSRIRGALGGIESDILYFVPPEADPAPVCPCEVWAMRIRNAGLVGRVLRVFSYVEFGYPDAVADQQNLDWAQHIVSSRCEDGVIRAGTRFSPTVSFFASSRHPLGYTCNRETFVGRAGDLAAPAVVVTGEPANAPSPSGNSIGSLCHEFRLMPGEEVDLTYVLGMTDCPSEIPAVVARYGDRREVDAAFGRLRDDWSTHLAAFTVATPDADTNAMLNTWNQVQCITTLHWSRFVSGFETGLARGMGTRDSAQDTLGVLHAVPDQARHMLTRTWAMQFRDGHAWHLFFPLTGEGTAGSAAEFPAWPQWFSDDHLWLVLASCAYVAETGDVEYLDRRVGWADGGDATVWGHLDRAVEFTLTNRGPHGLPRAGFADWDDTLNVDHGSGKAESVFTAMLFCRAVLDLAELCDFLRRDAEAARFRVLHREMAAAVNDAA
jgi:cellobiose phosphorylase